MCERSGYDTPSNGGRNSCLEGTSRFAIDAKKCAITKALDKCEDLGLDSCNESKVRVSFDYYFSHDPYCVAKAKVSK